MPDWLRPILDGWHADPRRSLKRAAGAALLLWLAWQIVVTTAAHSDADTDPEAALGWRPAEAEALVRLAERRLADMAAQDDLSAVDDLATRALLAAPDAIAPLSLLALTAERRGEDGRAAALMRLAERRSLRQPVVEAWLFDRAVAAGDIAGALGRADVLLRTSAPDLRERVRTTLIGVASDAKAAPLLVRQLAGDPPWRAQFLAAFFADPASLQAAPVLIAAMAATDRPLTDSERNAYLTALVARGLFDTAYGAWVDSFAGGDVPYLYNGGFEAPASGSPFDWTLADARIAEVAITASPPPATGNALRVEFADRRVAASLASELLVLPPGDYRLSAKAKAERLVNDRGLWWRVSCADGDRAVLAETDRIVGTLDWRPLEARFTIPESCHAEWLRLELAARVAVEEQVSGTAWFDDLAVSRLDPAVPSE